MATSKKIVKTNDKIDIITTNYNPDFLDNINLNGRKVIHDYNLISDEHFKRLKQNKANNLKNKTLRKLDTLCRLNVFKYFITIHSTQKDYKRLIDRLKKQDKELKFISLASWSLESNLHYHILIDSVLSIELIKKRLANKLDADIQIIDNTTFKTLLSYLKKNIVKNIIKELLLSDDEELKEKQIEILKYKNILSNSKNLNKPIEIKNPSQEQLLDIYNNATYLNTVEYNNLDSKIQIDKFTTE